MEKSHRTEAKKGKTANKKAKQLKYKNKAKKALRAGKLMVRSH